MHGFVRGLGVAVAVLLVVGACGASAAPQAAESPAAGAVSPEPTLTPTIVTSPEPRAIVSPGCDPAEAMFASMFVGLSEAALANAGIEPEEFFAALATNRETLKKYLEALGIPADDALIDAVMSANLGQRLLRDRLDEGSMAPGDGEWVVCE